MNLRPITEMPQYVYWNTGVQMWMHLRNRLAGALTEGRRRREGISNLIELERHRAELRSFFLSRMGGLPSSVMAPPPAQVTGETQLTHLRIENVILETRPGVFATANFYWPQPARQQKLPVVLFLCGHSADGRMHDRYQSVCQRFVAEGFAVFALDPTGQGERLNYFDPKSGQVKVRPATGDHEFCGFQCLLQGHNLSRYMIHDAMRAVDFLSQHPDIDASRIAVTGSSGGGTQTSLLMLMEPRIAAAAPATFVTTRLDIFDSGFAQDAEQIWPDFNGQGYDHADLLLSFAPKPLCLLGVKYDFFPIEGFRRTAGEVQRFWEMLGQMEKIRVFEDASVHLYTDQMADVAARFFGECLQSAPSGRISVEVQDSRQLWATRSGQIKSDFPHARTIFQENEADWLTYRERDGLQRAKALKFLREAVFRPRTSGALELRITRDLELNQIRVRSGYWWSQEDVINSGTLLEPTNGPVDSVTLALWDEGDAALVAHESWISAEIGRNRAIFVINLCGMGPLQPHPVNSASDLKEYYGTIFKAADDLVTLGDSLAAWRTYEVIQAAAIVPQWGFNISTPIDIYGSGHHGIYGVLAAALDARLRLRGWDKTLPTYEALLRTEYYQDYDIKSFIIPGLIRYADWCDLAPWPETSEPCLTDELAFTAD